MPESMASEPAEPTTRQDRAMLEVIAERDRAEEWADRLAEALAPADVRGEHSNGNDPWRNALEYAQRASGLPADPAQTTELEQLKVDGAKLLAVTEEFQQQRNLLLWLHAEAAWRVVGFDALTAALARHLKETRAERDALLPRLAELTEQAGKARTTEWLRTCDRLPIEEWSPAPAYKGSMVPAAELDERQARIDAALAVLDGASQFGLTKPGALHAVRAALAGEQPTTEGPPPGIKYPASHIVVEHGEPAPGEPWPDCRHGRPQNECTECPGLHPTARDGGVRDDTSEENQ